MPDHGKVSEVAKPLLGASGIHFADRRISAQDLRYLNIKQVGSVQAFSPSEDSAFYSSSSGRLQ